MRLRLKKRKSTITWKDITAYKRGERGIVEPRAWSTQIGRVGIIVTTSWVDEYMKWYLQVPFTGLYHSLDSLHVEEAKEEALRLIRQDLEGLLKALGEHGK